MTDRAGSFPHQQARTRRFSLGFPRNFTVSPDGERVAFLRSAAGDNPITSLWVYETTTTAEREVANASGILGAGEEQLPAEERARRERSRELARGIVDYACDEAVSHAVFALGGRLWWVDIAAGAGIAGAGVGAGSAGSAGSAGRDGAPVELPGPTGAVGPRPDPTGRLVAFLAGSRLCVVPTTGTDPFFVLAEDGDSAVTWGAAEFVAAEEMGRDRGFWWAPDGTSLLAARVDNSPVTTWWTADPSMPAAAPEAHRYPVAGGDDAVVTLWHLLPAEAGGERRQVRWDAERYPYLAAVHWGRGGPPLVLVEQRDHKACAVLAVDLGAATTSTVAESSDAAWVDWPPGVPAWLDSGELLWAAGDEGTWRLKVGPDFVTPPGLQVREVTTASGSVVFTGSTEPEVVEAWEWSAPEGLHRLTEVGGVSRALGPPA